ncbi:MAG: hypothetical protein A2265_12195, partial [Bacteroidetes bacterium RIFOXYA12_FULL_33_9]
EKPNLIFNLVETIYGAGRFINFAPVLFEHMNVSYSGCPADAIYLTSNKLTAKMTFNGYNLPTPKHITLQNIEKIEVKETEQYLIKSIWEHASVGIDEKVFKFYNNKADIFKILSERKIAKNESFAEQYIDGREFNISILGGKKGPQVLPFAEIKFVDYPADKPKIIGYRAKWDEESFEYKHTVRSFDFDNTDKQLLAKLEKYCIDCWNTFGLKGYARVDFRVDKQGNPYILEINTNPCISPDGGFVAACSKAGIPFSEVMTRILEDAV